MAQSRLTPATLRWQTLSAARQRVKKELNKFFCSHKWHPGPFIMFRIFNIRVLSPLENLSYNAKSDLPVYPSQSTSYAILHYI
jgi:hypothetical protein